MLLMIDNYDSFTYNLVQYFAELGEEVMVQRNDQVSVRDIKVYNPKRIVISPGPCTPNEAGVSLEIIEAFKDQVAILGVCLGHQSLAQVFGGVVKCAEKVMHGKTSSVYHNGQNVFKDLPSPFLATRYHSLVVEKASLPDCFELTAWTKREEIINEGIEEDIEDEVDEIMGIAHKSLPLYGVQFHPESILSEQGHALLQNFLDLSA